MVNLNREISKHVFSINNSIINYTNWTQMAELFDQVVQLNNIGG